MKLKRGALVVVYAFLLLADIVRGDVYLHNMRGSNNRLNEETNNRANANRLFDSQVRGVCLHAPPDMLCYSRPLQNNDRGGYNVGDNFANKNQGPLPHGIMTYYVGTLEAIPCFRCFFFFFLLTCPRVLKMILGSDDGTIILSVLSLI
jgi:hypothetical protein